MSRPHLRLILLLLILAVLGPPGISTEKSVGCLFSERLCLEDEWCYDDLAFGRCLPATTDLDQDDLHRYALEREGLHQLNKELRRLFALGYRWSHGYTQCRLQTLLYAFKHDLEFEVNACSHLSDNDLEGALRALEGQVELEPEEVAIIKYTPSVEDPHASFADEVYYPPADVRAREELRQKILSPNAIPLDMPDPYADLVVKRAWYPPMKRDIAPFFDGRYGVAKYRRFDQEPSQDSLEFLQKYENEYPDGPLRLSSDPFLDISSQKTLQDAAEFLSQMQLTPEEINQIFTPENYRKLQKFIESYSDSDASLNSPSVKSLIQQKIAEMRNEVSDGENFDDNLQAMEQASEDQSRFPSTYNSPNTFRAGYEVKDEVIPDFDTDDKGHFLDDVRIYDEPEDQNTQDPTESGSGHSIGFFSEEKYNDILNPRDAIFRERQQKQDEENERFQRKWGKFQHPQVVYSEGGVDEPENGETQEELLNMDDDDFANIWRYNMGFKRPERLDVKKPGPPFDPLTLEEPQQNVRSLLKKSQREPKSPIKKNPRNPNPNSIDLSYARRYPEELYVKVSFRNLLKDWETGHNILQNISNLLHMDLKDFTDSQVNFYDITFRVNPANNRGYNETDVAKKIELIQGDLEKLSGATLESISVGTREKTQEVYFSRINTENRYIVLFLVCGVLVALILASAVLILIRRHIKIKEKLHGLTKPDAESSKDYQDLCRARMATKGQSGTTEGSGKGRITSLSKESEQSPSSRSSTSSWSEEPALNNMDISTGHMVLSYMEDHLKNKDRLDQEWVALCAYVAEPCETSVAMKKNNIEKNRYPEVVPYDHARVVLNELSNIAGCDYINASSITDHDPRNPAYIATQGPLPHTAPDFWQMIWEQGAVVIVMLTRLTEGGAAMCHRYWPEEGSEVYHIYEVHLVSEHIWCDDYLVRSFYLKNVRTGETRTVTQFHFLSWPEAGVPSSTKALLEFRRKVNKSYRGRSCPIVVHCSDGAGRTGTYCLIDMVLSRMAKGAKEIDIAATLEHLRDQRPKMVATKQQFEFVLTAVAEEVHAILKALPPQPTPPSAQEKSEK